MTLTLHLTDAKKIKIVTECNKGKTLEELSAKTGISVSSIRNILKAMGIELRSTGRNAEHKVSMQMNQIAESWLKADFALYNEYKASGKPAEEFYYTLPETVRSQISGWWQDGGWKIGFSKTLDGKPAPPSSGGWTLRDSEGNEEFLGAITP